MKYFRKGTFLYVLSEDNYLMEIDNVFSLYGVVEFNVQYEPSVTIDWKLNAKEISKKTFDRYYKHLKKINSFLPNL